MSKKITDEIFVEELEEDSGDFYYDLTPYHFNMDVEGLIRRYKSKDIIIPSFQRNYVWTKDGASMFIDSVLRGLPSPSFFFYEEESQRYLVIDGQQRLLSLFYFVEGYFPEKKAHQAIAPISKDISKENFSLTGKKIHPDWKGRCFKDLSPQQQKRILNTYIYIINLKQIKPTDDNSSMYLVFERINTGATPLNPQQIRLCVYHGNYADFISNYAQKYEWLNIFRLSDVTGGISELILRFFSLYYTAGEFKGSMKSFLDKELKNNRNFEKHSKDKLEILFERSFAMMCKCFDSRTFSPKKNFNGYMFLVYWIVIGKLLETNSVDPNKIQEISIKMIETNEWKEFIENSRRASSSKNLMEIICFSEKYFIKNK
ncbi:DUF262 domain-containing protein [Treponema denticola]|uniref:DUF262 domain-containing protein n=1 Tax=Treponema denticola TaxID=158 RepID=UPI0002B52933|nr:DUF262 domain-containing protein [Treponema denticola]EMB26207.1 hypothetical protein HMPREF9724_00737 [Treponema denticola SP37]EPF34054.1 hypothetical protein HMPREF9734_01060 [Treponema denticola SP44]EPF39233.1 hypothetical protein HMPREF9731_01594 [Treponema denticola SP23]